MPAVISNASPLIGLSAIDQLGILRELWGEIVIPDAVYKETVIDGKGKPGANKIDAACGEWIKIATVLNRSEVEVLKTIGSSRNRVGDFEQFLYLRQHTG